MYSKEVVSDLNSRSEYASFTSWILMATNLDGFKYLLDIRLYTLHTKSICRALAFVMLFLEAEAEGAES